MLDTLMDPVLSGIASSDDKWLSRVKKRTDDVRHWPNVYAIIHVGFRFLELMSLRSLLLLLTRGIPCV